MKRKANFIIIATAVCVAVLALFSACGRAQQNSTVVPTQSLTLPVIEAQTGAIIEYTTVGSVVSDRRIEVASRLSGYIRDILVQEGDLVQNGQVLARLDAADVQGAIDQARAGVGAAKAAFNDAKTDLERFRMLFKSGTVSENEWRKMRLKFEASRQTLNQAQAGLDAALAQRVYAEIKSPMDGVVVARFKRIGDLALPGVPLLTLESRRDLLFETFVAEKQISAVSDGQIVQVRIDGVGGPLEGTVRRVVPSGDPVTRTYRVKIALPQTNGLRPGMFGRAVFPLGNSRSPVVPRPALVERGGLRGVFVVDDSRTAHFRWLRIGREWPDRVEVTAGLKTGERLVAQPIAALRDGDTISEKNVRYD
ncbi:MAG: efflux RND transporter periplasmic adaptor subunit [Desulfatitalea sp.]|nr:efflux RND transporter periplasmic adaptor subunit [Desulfatitalea sp.]NNJ99291.1 efflux RND transporter periplasmic adaptor subunit [Desulfatitalea sp.]